MRDSEAALERDEGATQDIWDNTVHSVQVAMKVKATHRENPSIKRPHTTDFCHPIYGAESASGRNQQVKDRVDA
jgi:hypothetical protein